MGTDESPDFVTISEAAKCLDMTSRTIERMVEAGSLVGYVRWDEVRARLLPTRPPHHD
jgi:hypothetical protein